MSDIQVTKVPCKQRGPRPKVKGKVSKRGAWGYEASKAMHEAHAARIDLREARRKARLEARAERKARVRIRNGERGADVA